MLSTIFAETNNNGQYKIRCEKKKKKKIGFEKRDCQPVLDGNMSFMHIQNLFF